MFGPKIRVERDLYEKLKECAETAGYSSVDEFVQHVLQRETDKLGKDDADADETRKRLEGLGYIS